MDSIVSLYGKLVKPIESGKKYGFGDHYVFVVANSKGAFQVETDQELDLRKVGQYLHIDGELRTREKGGMYVFANRITREL